MPSSVIPGKMQHLTKFDVGGARGWGVHSVFKGDKRPWFTLSRCAPCDRTVRRRHEILFDRRVMKSCWWKMTRVYFF